MIFRLFFQRNSFSSVFYGPIWFAVFPFSFVFVVHLLLAVVRTMYHRDTLLYRPPGVREIMGSIPVGDSEFSFSYVRVMLINSPFTFY